MKRLVFAMLFLVGSIAVFAQGTVRGTVYDRQNDEPLGFVNVKITDTKDKIVDGGMTDVDGKFNISLKYGKYKLTLSYIGYKDVVREFSLSADKKDEHFNRIFMSEDTHQLKEVTVVGQKSAMKLEVDRKSFDVSQMISNAGQSASEVLENIPSVEVDNDGNVSLRGNASVEVWINGKASGLTSDNRAQILQQLPAESIERIEVIDNPSAKFSAEGSAGIINIVLKKDRKAGYYGSVQAGADTRGGYNGSVNFNYNSSWLDAFASIGTRRHKMVGKSESEQKNFASETDHANGAFQEYTAEDNNEGKPLFTRAGLTFHLTQKDDLSFTGMMMHGHRNGSSVTPYNFGTFGPGTSILQRIQTRTTENKSENNMLNGELGYHHEFGAGHFLDITAGWNKWHADNENWYLDENNQLMLTPPVVSYSYQYRPMDINNKSNNVKVDYENAISQKVKVQAGYNGDFSHENTPQQSFEAKGTSAGILNGTGAQEDYRYFNRFIYDMDTHALYATLTANFGKFGIQGGLRGEYWKVDTKSDYYEDGDPSKLKTNTFKKDYFKLFPSVFASYQLTESDQLQLNYSRRLRRPWGGQLNSFKDTRDATMVSFGNPELTPEFSNSFSLNYLKTWTEHSLLLSLYYRPTTDVMQRISYRDVAEDVMYSTTMNVAKSTSSGAELTVKNKLFRILDLTTNINAYYYKLDGFKYMINDQMVTGDANKRFTWNARTQASFILPYDMSVQTSIRYRSKEAITQGYRPANCSMDFGFRKNFFNKLFTLSVNCRDLLNSRKWESTTEGPNFWRHQINRRNSRTFSATLTWNFGNTKPKKRPMEQGQGEGQDMQDYNSAGMEY